MKNRNQHSSPRRIGVFCSWFYGDFQYEVVCGIEYEAHLHDIQIIYFTGRPLHSPYPHEKDYNIVYDIASDASLDGLVVLSGITDYSHSKQIDEFISRYSALPLITINVKTSCGNAILTNCLSIREKFNSSIIGSAKPETGKRYRRHSLRERSHGQGSAG